MRASSPNTAVSVAHPLAPSGLRLRVLRRIPRAFVPLLALLASALYVVHLRDREQDLELARQRVIGVEELQAEIVRRELDWARFTILNLASDPLLAAHLSGDDRRGDLEGEFQRACGVSRIFDQVRLIDASGQEVVRVNFDGSAASPVPASELQSKSDRYYFERTWEIDRGAVYISPFDLNVEHGIVEQPWKPVVRIGTPCFDRAGAKRGLLVLNYLGADLLARLARAADAAPGWSTLVNRDGYYLDGPDPSRSWGFLFGAEPTFVADHPDAWALMAQEPGGSLLGKPGLVTFRRIVPVAQDRRQRVDLGLHAVSIVPNDALYASSRAKLWRLSSGGAILAALLLLGSWGWAHVGVVRDLHERSLAESGQRLRRLSSRLLDAQESERRRLSRDLHDDAGQLITALTIDLGRAERMQDAAAKDGLIRRARDETARLLEAVRRISASLRSTELADLGLEGALRAYFADLAERTGLTVDARIELGAEELPVSVALHLYRIVQEALSNVLRHAETDEAAVLLLRMTDRVELVVRDAGVGFDPSAPADGIGLVGMRERAELCGGELVVLSEPRHGTRLEAFVRLDPADGVDSEAGAA